MTAADAVRGAARPLTGAPDDYDAVLRLAEGRRFVLLGEASHGTHEFYRVRAEITKRLVDELGFTVVAVEADWPDAYRVNRYVRGSDDDQTAERALADFRRFPAWMWRNGDVLDFVGWLRERNDGVSGAAEKAGFYGLDLYSLSASVDAVLAYLDEVDQEAAARARARYACFEHFHEEPQAYGYASATGAVEPCEEDVVAQLVELRRQAADVAARDGRVVEDRHFYAEQNARLVANAERYYRSMFRGRASSWNLRDAHMADTLDALVGHLERHGGPAKAVVWAHNSHLGDARATEMAARGELNLGQLVRERHDGESLLVGFSTYAGTVTAASDWGGPAERKRVRAGLPQSWEALFHGLDGDALLTTAHEEAREALMRPRVERAIGVIYRPETERQSHYFEARVAAQFDVVVHLDETRAVEPLEPSAEWRAGAAPETYPSGL